MCHNIIDGRYHTQCFHFVEMATRSVDCLRPDCLFSSRHVHPVGCRNSQCIRLMNQPVKNPIRVSPSNCPNCIHKSLGGPIGHAQAAK
ncbi:hypothetical protein CC1G_13914 [Coprinopsis cinerea okayama7|uniref:Uncharacterized protein n=1 Tax=Coprinopsis cinerea (strain Okayama-7 / 130 / ATCC MYA-4618 / FGSC 9003) TaxID=240176 RepID=D6RKG4_COPC7|nr:hypothetical protein CC1G_13914 [Coprinopsis cinerea okayama7\|eukprot:XP_002911874.1 hypothetical protein CC1G_13914 [Coprinopsis cinerea okayama7\